MDEMTKLEISGNIRRSQELFDFLNKPDESAYFLERSAFIELLIITRDLMYKTELYATRIDFTDDVVQTDKVNDVTDLIKFARDAVSHPESQNHFLDSDSRRRRVTNNILRGEIAIDIEGLIISSDYIDDICLQVGTQKVYFRRHLHRAVQEAINKLVPLF